MTEMMQQEGGVNSGTERKKAKADSGKGAGRESGETESEQAGAEAGKESSQKQMEQLGVLTEIDMAAFAGYCQAYARWKEAEEYISEHGTVMKAPSGYCQQVP